MLCQQQGIYIEFYFPYHLHNNNIVLIKILFETFQNSKPLAVGYIAGYVLILLALLVCFGLAFQYRVIYPYYFYNSYSAAYSYYQQYNPSGQAFCAILGIDLIYIFVSLILVGVFAKRESAYGDGDEWHIRSTATPSTAPVNEYGRDGVRIA